MHPQQRSWTWRLFAGGAVLCALPAVARLPFFPTTAAAQLMAAVGQTPEWSRAAAFGRPAPALAPALAAAPTDATLHLGAAAWERAADESAEAEEPAWCGDSYRRDAFQARGLAFRDPERPLAPPSGINGVRRELARLSALGRRFPDDPSVRAYQLRSLLRGPVWIPHASPFTPAERRPPSQQLLQQFDAIARSGQRLEPTNGFFDAMRAAAAFAGHRDDAGLRHLHAAVLKRSWNDYAIDETRAVWKLLHAAYGDCGVEQLLPTETFLLLPHFATLHVLAGVVVRRAAAFDRAGAHARAREVRGDILRLGLRLQDQSPLLAGKQTGDTLFYLGMAPATPKAVGRELLRSDSERRQRRERYAASLEAQGDTAQAVWVRAAGERIDAMNGRIRRVRDAQSRRVPFWPPTGLAFWWELGVILLQQLGALLALWAGVLLLARWVDRKRPAAGPPNVISWVAAHVLLISAPLLLSIALREGSTWLWQECITVGVAMAGLLAIALGEANRRQPGTTPALSFREQARRPGIPSLIALLSTVLPFALLTPFLSYVSQSTQGGSIFGLPWWGPPLGLTLPEVAFLPAMFLCCFALCWGAMRGLPPLACLCRGVRLAAPHTAALLALLYLATAVPASRANFEATRQMENALSAPFAAMEAPRDLPSVDLALEP